MANPPFPPKPPADEKDFRLRKARLEAELLAHYRQVVELGASTLVDALRTGGWTLAADAAPVQWTLRLGSKILRLSLPASLGVSLSFDEPRAPAELLTDSFYAFYDRAAAKPAARRTEAERGVFAIASLEAEVSNGGFHQYFFNSASDHLQDAFVALGKIGADDVRELLAEAVEAFPAGEVPADRDERQAALARGGAKLTKLLSTLDSRFYELGQPLNVLGMALLPKGAAKAAPARQPAKPLKPKRRR